VTEARPWEDGGGVPRRVGINAFGFGGINAHVILEEAAAPAAPAARQDAPAAGAWPRTRRRRRTDAGDGPPVRLFVAAADDPAALAERLADDDAVLAGTALAGFAERGPARIAIADPTPRRLDLARRAVARGRPWRGRNDVWFSADGLIAGGGGVAFAFPGIESAVGARVDDVAEHFGLDLERPVRASPLETQGAEIVFVGRVLAEGLARVGVRPDAVVGHSLGEWTAMIVAGAATGEAIERFVSRIADGEFVLPDLLFLALGCAVGVAEEAIAGLPDIAVSHDNCPHQVIVCGSEASVAEAQRRLAARRVLGQVLPFRTGFHTPMFRDYLGPLERAWGDMALHAPRIPLYSSVTAAPFPDHDDGVWDLARRLYVERVRFRELVERLHADGIRAFVQVGAGSVAGFVGDTLHDHDHLAVTASQAGRSGLAQLTRAAGALFVEGADVALDRLVPAGPAAAAGHVPRSAVLRFDSPLVRAGLAPLDRPATAPPAPAAAGPVADEFLATLRAVDAASRDVLAALATGRAPAPAATPAAPLVPAPATAPDRHHERRRLSLADVPELADHSFYNQPPGVGSVGDLFPVVPMTMMIAIFVEVAAALGGGRTVVGLQNVRALRWLAVEPAIDVDITAAVEGPDRVKVAIEGYARATVVLADRYPAAPPPDDAPLTGERPPPHSARELYEDRWMFHGPAYQGVTATHAMGDDGLRATVTALPAPGALLDAAGQLLAYWIEANSVEDRMALPMRIDRIDFYGPHPEPGAELACLVRLTDFNETDARGNVDLVRDGEVWARLTQFVDRRFETSGAVFEVMRAPDRRISAERGDGYWLLAEPWRSSAARDLVARRYLGGAERDQYFALTPNAQTPWLLGRVALKDAVRDHLWRHGAGPIFPIEVRVADDPAGRPAVEGPGGRRPVVSLAQRPGVAVAAVAEEGEAGIDLEVDITEEGELVVSTIRQHR
jgi:hypothetical protein